MSGIQQILKFYGKCSKIEKREKQPLHNFHAISPIQSLKCLELRTELSFFTEKLMERAQKLEKQNQP